jgi:DNA-binding MarR family transcriptional regulator
MYDIHGLKNSQRVIYNEICRLLAEGKAATYTALQDATGYSRPTVWRAISALEGCGYIERVGDSIVVQEQEEIVISIFKSLINMAIMNSNERWERLIIALSAKRIYDSAKRLNKLARKSDNGTQERVERFMKRTGADRLTKVWPLDEAAQIQEQIDELLTELEQ